MAILQGAIGRRSARQELSLRHRPVEDPGQPPAQPDEPTAVRAPRLGSVLAARSAALLDGRDACHRARAQLPGALSRPPEAPPEPRALRAGDRVPRPRSGRRGGRHGPGGHPHDDHAQASSSMDVGCGYCVRARRAVVARTPLARDGRVPGSRGGYRGARRAGKAVGPLRGRPAPGSMVHRTRACAVGEPAVQVSRGAAAARRPAQAAALGPKNVALLRTSSGCPSTTTRKSPANRRPTAPRRPTSA
jgi:hypothetical protein